MRKPLTEKQILAREHMYFKKRIRSVFETAGFTYLPTEGKEHEIAHRTVEVDMVFIFENILLVCEDTTKQTHIIEHLQNKYEAFTGIGSEFYKYYKFLCDDFPDKANLISKYDYEAYHVFYLYFSKHETSLSEEDYLRFEPILIVEPQTLEYFTLMKRCIKRTSRNEIFRFLGVTSSDIGDKGSSSYSKEVEAPIIYPKAITGLRNGVRVVSFMMSAEFLMNTCYVLRKDNWETSMWLYQRLLDEDKIKSIRKYLVSTQLAFFNNILLGYLKT